MTFQNVIDEIYEKVYKEVYEKGYADGKRDCESTKAEKHGIDLGMVLVEAGIMNDKEISSFYIGRYPITRKEWFEIYPKKDDGKGKLYRPITYISWYDAIDYCNYRSVKEGLEPYYPRSGTEYTCNHKANGYRLPTEAEWEYAACGGLKGITDNFKYAGSNDIDEVAWHNMNSKGRIHRVGKKKPNQLGIYDMSGNVWEWCWDKYTSGSYRVFRGGGWYDVPAYAHVDNRGRNSPDTRDYGLGFRVVRNAE